MPPPRSELAVLLLMVLARTVSVALPLHANGG